MTGYAYKEVTTEKASLAIEIKSVNSRFLDLSLNMPGYLNPLEAKFRTYISSQILRGKVDVNIRIKNLVSNEKVTADPEAAKSFYAAIACVADAVGKSKDDIPLSLIIGQPGVLIVEQSYDMDYYESLITPVLKEVVEHYVADCRREGENLFKDLSEKLAVLDRCAAFFKDWQPKMECKFKETVTAKFTELVGSQFDEQRVLTEVAALLVKYTINEEVVRLHSHLSALRQELKDNPAPGKKIDFLCQEINREINTIGSKSVFTEVSDMVVTAKDALENIREQAKNVQ